MRQTKLLVARKKKKADLMTAKIKPPIAILRGQQKPSY
jgi:hypothetical protein